MNTQKVVSIIVVILVVAVGGYFAFRYSGKTGTSTVSTAPNASTTVATVNGVVISKTVFDAQLETRINTYKTQGVDVTDATKLAQIKTQLLDDLINNEVVTQEVAKAGTTVTPAEIESQFQALLTQAGGADGLKKQLTTANLTEAQLRTNIAGQLVIQKFLISNISTSTVTVSDKEIKDFYDANTKDVKNPPALKSVTAQIKQQLTTNKEQILINAFVASLRAKADVKTY